MLEIFSENVIQIILTSQELARAENSKSVDLHHLLGGLIYHKKSSAGVILEKLKIQKKDINFPEIQNNAFFYEVALSKSSQKVLQKALEESTKVERWHTYLRSIFILKAIILDNSESLNFFIDDFDKKKLDIYEEIKNFEEFVPEIPKSESSLLPNDIFAEKAILGSILLDSKVINSIEETLSLLNVEANESINNIDYSSQVRFTFGNELSGILEENVKDQKERYKLFSFNEKNQYLYDFQLKWAPQSRRESAKRHYHAR